MRRGDVVVVRRPVGFTDGLEQRMVVVQADRLCSLATVLVVPLCDAKGPLRRDPTAVGVTRTEAGTRGDQVAVVPGLRAVATRSLESTVVGRLAPTTLGAVDAVLRLVLELP